MAVLNEERGIEVHVTCGGQPLQEHHDPDIEEVPRVATRYIEAKTGDAFAIRLNVQNNTLFRGDVIACRVTVDGIRVMSRLIARNVGKMNTVVDVDGAVVSASSKVPLLFTDLSINSDPLLEDLKGHEDIGAVKVCLTHEHKGDLSSDPKMLDILGDARDNPAVVTEKILKGRSISHRVSFGAPITQKTNVFQTTAVKKHPEIGTFIFYYRSRESLKAMLLIPRTPTPPPLEARQPSELSHSEIAELQRRIMTKETELVRMKRERTDEASPGPRKRARLDARSPTLELLDDDSFREVKSEELIVPKEEIIDLD